MRIFKRLIRIFFKNKKGQSLFINKTFLMMLQILLKKNMELKDGTYRNLISV